MEEMKNIYDAIDGFEALFAFCVEIIIEYRNKIHKQNNTINPFALLHDCQMTRILLRKNPLYLEDLESLAGTLRRVHEYLNRLGYSTFARVVKIHLDHFVDCIAGVAKAEAEADARSPLEKFIDGIKGEPLTRGPLKLSLEEDQACYDLNGVLKNAAAIHDQTDGKIFSARDVFECRNLVRRKNDMRFGRVPFSPADFLPVVQSLVASCPDEEWLASFRSDAAALKETLENLFAGKTNG